MVPSREATRGTRCAQSVTPRLLALARVPASLADLGAALLVFEVLRTRRPLQLAARSAILVAVSPVLFVASGLHGDRMGWPWPCSC